jgi:hypothetical protein
LINSSEIRERVSARLSVSLMLMAVIFFKVFITSIPFPRTSNSLCLLHSFPWSF